MNPNNLQTRWPLFLFVVLSLCASVSCGPVIKTIYGIKKPRFTTDTKVIKYADRLKFDQEIYRLKNFDFQPVKDFKISSMPEVRAYSANGNRLTFEKSCTADYLKLISMSPDELSELTLDADENINNWMSATYSLIDKNQNKWIKETPKFVVIFATYLGKLNKINTKPWIDVLAQRDDIEFFVLNVDISTETNEKSHVNIR